MKTLDAEGERKRERFGDFRVCVINKEEYLCPLILADERQEISRREIPVVLGLGIV